MVGLFIKKMEDRDRELAFEKAKNSLLARRGKTISDSWAVNAIHNAPKKIFMHYYSEGKLNQNDPIFFDEDYARNFIITAGLNQRRYDIHGDYMIQMNCGNGLFKTMFKNLKVLKEDVLEYFQENEGIYDLKENTYAGGVYRHCLDDR